MHRPHVAPLLLLITALPAQRSLLDTLPQTAEAHQFTGFGVGFEPLVLPGEGTPRGIAAVGKVVWLLRGAELLRLAWPSAQVEYRVEAPAALNGLCSDGRLLYSLGTAEVVVLDPIAGRPVRSLPLEAEQAPSAIGWHAGALHTAVGREVRRLGVDGKEVEARFPVSPAPVLWLTSDGARLWAASRSWIRPLEPKGVAATAWQGGRWPLHFAVGAGAWIDGRLLLAAEYTDSKKQSQVLAGLWSPVVEPELERLSVKVHRTATGLSWEVGPKPLASLARMKLELLRIAADPSAQIAQADGKKRLMPVVLEAYPGVTVEALAETWDAVVEAGFPDVSSPAQEAWARDRLAWARKGLQQPPK